jgi:hypothetical protein
VAHFKGAEDAFVLPLDIVMLLLGFGSAEEFLAWSESATADEIASALAMLEAITSSDG